MPALLFYIEPNKDGLMQRQWVTLDNIPVFHMQNKSDV